MRYQIPFKKLVHLFGKICRFVYYFYLRQLGVKIGRKTMISLRAKIDTRRGQISIGDNSHITYGCIIISHDASAKQRNQNSKNVGNVFIGKNVFIGVGSIVLPNVSIGDNTVIGAGSVVTRNIPANVIAAGNPAKIIKTIS